ncbi:MAG: thioredoxin [Ruminiclostridium sp.]|nr:thioredoxin [Ruminiclostridium sp.]
MSVIKVTKRNFENEVMQSEKTVLIDFWASWCSPCKMISPIIDEIAHEASDIRICKINIDEEPELTQKFRIMSVPTLTLIKNGKVIDSSVGLKSKAEVMKMIGHYM